MDRREIVRAAEVLDYAKQRLAFLEQLHRLRRRQEGGTPATTLRYRGRELGFEVAFEWREAAVDLLVVRLSDGVVPAGGYYVHEGRRVRWHLGDVIAGSFPDQARRLREAYALEPPDRDQRPKLELDVYAEVLQVVAADVLRGGHEALDALDRADRRRAERRLP
jgi:hypothetical protein